METKVYSDILDKIDLIIKEKELLHQSITQIETKNLNKSQSKEIRKILKEKEKTYRRMIRDLRRIYDDQSGRTVRKSILKTARIAVKNGEQIDFDKLLSDLEKTR